MVETPLTQRALSIAAQAHEGQVDKGGHPYIEHPRFVAEQMKTEAETAAALLHDVAEDTDTSLEELYGPPNNIPLQVVLAVQRLTHFPSQAPYMEYIDQIRLDPISRAVKLADLQHNMDASRLKQPLLKADLERQEKYRAAYKRLQAPVSLFDAELREKTQYLFAPISEPGPLYYNHIYMWEAGPVLFSCWTQTGHPILCVEAPRESQGHQWLSIAITPCALSSLERGEFKMQGLVNSPKTLCFWVSEHYDAWDTAWVRQKDIPDAILERYPQYLPTNRMLRREP